MYDEKSFPFYAAYSNPVLRTEEREQEKEFILMKSYYPEMALKIQKLVEEECQLLDYEGSRIYDEYPDRFMLWQMCRRIKKEAEPRIDDRKIPESFLDDLIQVLLYQEISRRRCRKYRCRTYF